MLNHNSSKPLHHQLEEIIREKLRCGEWKENELIPSENELARIYGISRMTVRGVILRLVQEDLLYRISGKGTYVCAHKIDAKSPSYAGIREQLEQMGYEVTTQLISLTLEEGSSDMCTRFKLPEGSKFFVQRRLRSIKGEPISLHTSYVPHVFCPDLKDFDLENEQLCKILGENYRLYRNSTEETLESVAARGHEAKLLQIRGGSPLLLLKDSIKDAANNVFEYTKILFRGDKIRIKLNF